VSPVTTPLHKFVRSPCVITDCRKFEGMRFQWRPVTRLSCQISWEVVNCFTRWKAMHIHK